MELLYWKNFSKRRNSTKRPTGGTLVNVHLKENTTLEAPSFILNTTDHDINYVRAFDHYYFVSQITFLNANQIQLDCVEDVLATHKTAILQSPQFVMYSASQYHKYIPDPRITVSTNRSVVTATASSDYFDSTGLYVVTVSNKEAGDATAGCSYIMDKAKLKSLMQYLNSDITTAVTDWLQNIFLKPFESIISCIWMPLKYSKFAESVPPEVIIGKDNISGLYATKITNPAPVTFSLVLNPNRQYDGTDFRNSEPYQSMELYIPFYGITKLNPMDVMNGLKVTTSVDFVTGDATTYLYDNTDEYLLQVLNYNIGVNCPLAQVSNQANGALSSIGSVAAGIASLASGGGAAAGIGIASGAINAAVDFAKVTTSVKGSIQGRSMTSKMDYELNCFAVLTQDPADLVATMGRPLFERVTLSTLTGYCQCENASVSIDDLEGAKSEINSYLNNGFYIE